jgi:signal transduction histidine kinase
VSLLLSFLLALAVLLTLLLDLDRTFVYLPTGGRLMLVVLSAAHLALLAWPRFRRRLAPRPRASVTWLVVGGLLLGLTGLLESIAAERLRAGWDEGARGRLERRAAIVEEDFARFLDRFLRPLRSEAPFPDSPAGPFEEAARRHAAAGLGRERYGLTLHAADGALLGWEGNTTDPPARLQAGLDGLPGWATLAGDLVAPRLYAVARAEDGTARVAEYLLRRPIDPDSEAGDRLLEFDFLPRWSDIAPAHVQMGRPAERDDVLEGLFERHDDRLWGQRGRRRTASLTIPLRADAAGPHLASVTLLDRPAEAAIAALRNRLRRGVVLVLAAIVALVWLPLPGRAPARLLAAGGAIWSLRFILLQIGDAADLPQLSIYDIRLYASSALGGLLRSPADLLLSALACLLQVWSLRRFLAAVPVPAAARRARRLAVATFAALVPALVAAAAVVHLLLDQMALDSRIDLLRVSLDGHLAPRTAVQAALFILVSSFAMLLQGVFLYGLRCRTVPGSGAPSRGALGAGADRVPQLLRAGGAVFLLTLLYVPILQHAYDRLRIGFFEGDLIPRVRYQSQRRLDILNDSLLAAREPRFATLAHFAADSGAAGDPGVAYRLWSRTPMASMGLASTLRLYDEAGRILSSFEVDVAPAAQVPFEVARRQAGGDPTEHLGPTDLTVRERTIFGSRWIRAPRRRPLLVVMSIVNEYDNVPMMHSGDTYTPLLSAHAPSRTNPELLRFDPMLAVFDRSLGRVYESGDDIPPPTAAHLERLASRPIVWTSATIGEHRSQVAYFEADDGMLFALTMPLPGPAERFAEVLRLFLLNASLVLAFAVARLAWAALRSGAAPRPWFGSTFYGRLTAIYLLTTLVPLLALSYFVTRFSTRELDRNLVTDGLRSLQTVRRMVSDYLAISQSGEEPVLDDDVVFWLSKVVRQEITLYVDGRRAATSTPELFSAGVVNERLDGAVHRALFLRREAFDLDARRPGALTLSAPLVVDRGGAVGVISLSLAAHRRAVALKTMAVRDAILISTWAAVLLLSVVGWRVARRVAGPIAELGRAAERLRAGDLDVRVEPRTGDEIGSLVVTFNDMAAALKRQRLDLERRRDYIETIVNSATTGVLSIDVTGALITINPAAARLLAAAPGPPRVGADLLQYLSRDPALNPLGRALSRALAGGRDFEIEVDLVHGERERRLRAVFLRFVPVEAPAGVIVLLEDVTEIVRSGRLAAWAEMARRIAHEVKNPLTPIQLSVEHLRAVWKAGDARFGEVLRECLDNIQGQVRTLREIASEFSAYAQLPELRPAPVEVGDLIRDALRPYATSPPPGVRFETDLPAGMPPVLADRAVVLRALVNLIENAVQALAGGGRVDIAARIDDGAASRRSVRIEVRDDGPGIDPRTMSRLFEPYFSTKRGGTGLGLAIARKAAEQHGGSLDIDSRPGQGTVVVLRLPVAAAFTAEGSR